MSSRIPVCWPWLLILFMVSSQPDPVARRAAADPPKTLASPVEDGPFLRPAEGEDAEPTWGVKGGIEVGLWPNPGPRGLIRIYSPYLGQPRLTPVNFIAVEPVVGRSRGLSELEPSSLDPGARGKAMWSANTLEQAFQPGIPWKPARGEIGIEDGRKCLSVFIGVEPFRHGARPVVEIRLREDRPHEAGFRVFSAPGGKAMRSCILSATMGNYARLRRLYLKDRVEEARRLYEPFHDVSAGFAPHREWRLADLLIRDGCAIVAATPNEAEPAHARYSPRVVRHWHYQGAVATQYWRARAHPNLVARVNGRETYWASNAPIPGGVAFENFELEAPFEDAQEFWFGVVPEPPRELGFKSP